MQLKKLLQGTTFAIVAAACAIVAPNVVKAAPTNSSASGITDVKVANDKMTITSSAKEVRVGIGKVNKSGKVTVASWASYDPSSSGATVDLSKLNNAKDNYLVLTTSTATGVDVVKIPAADVTKAGFNVETGVIQIATKPKKVAKSDLKDLAKEDSKKYEYRTQYSAWADLGTDSALTDLSMYQEEGAQLFVRQKGTATAASVTEGTEEVTYGTSTTKIKVNDAVSLPGKETKVKIPARAKGPKAVIDYTKGTVKFPKNSEYRLVGATAIQTADSTSKKYKTGSTTPITIAKLVEGDTNFGSLGTFEIDVRTVATKTKAASKWSFVSVTKPVALTSDYLTKKDAEKLTEKKGKLSAGPADSAYTFAGDGVNAAEVKEGTTTKTKVLDIKYTTKGKLDEYYKANAVEIKNNGELDYEIVVNATTPAEDAKSTKIAKGKTVTMKIDDGSKLWIRVAGDKKTTRWVGVYAELGTVDYPVEIPAKAKES